MSSDLTTRLGGARSSLAFKAPCRVASTANITIVGAGFQVVDGETFASTDEANGLNMRILLKNQTDTTENGIYEVSDGTWERSRDFDGNADIVEGTRVYVAGGTVGATTYVVTGSDPIVIGTSAITFVTESSLLGSGIECLIDNGGAGIPLNTADYLEAPFNGVINMVTLLATPAGSITVDVYKCTYAQFDGGVTHPVAADKITASAPPTITSGTKSQDSTLTGWTTSVSKGDILWFQVTSTSGTVGKVVCSLRMTRIQ